MNTPPDHSLAYVREAVIPEQAPPITQIGAIKWIRENLFSGWFNSILTVVSLYVVIWAIASIGPWLSNSVWVANSLTECRAILDGTNAACFAVITERWKQLLYGFYPSSEYWRPNLTLGLLFVALAPLLFPAVPKKLLWFSAIYPAVALFLLWGGSFWFPFSIVVGFAVGYLAFRLVNPILPLVSVPAAVLGAVVWWMFLLSPFTEAMSALLSIDLMPVRSDRFGGFMLSIIIGFSGIVISLPLGILLALGRQSDMIFVKTVCVIFIEFFRGVPLITLLFTAQLLLNYFLPPGTTFDLILRVIIMVTLFAAAYIAEVIRGGLAALPRGQYEAADALGLDYWRAQRLIIMPQALKISIPGIVNTFIGLFKDTTLVVFIGLFDPIGLSNAIRADTNWNGIYWELFIFIGALFFIFCFSMSRYSMYLERRLKTDHR